MLLLSLALLLSALEASQLYFRASLEGWRVTVPSLAGRALASWLTLAALVPGILLLARRWPLWRPSAKHLLLHVGAAVAFVVLHTTITAALLVGLDRHPWSEVLYYLIVAYTAIDLVLYCTVVGGWHAWHASRTASERAVTNARLQQELQQTQLAALRSQLNPHFLFNTLNAISGVALKGDGHATADALGTLSDLLRDGMRPDAPQLHTLREELALIERYASILTLRFPDAHTITETFDPSLWRARVPYMVLQPIVENAAQHGRSGPVGSGRIAIEARRDDHVLVLTVRDSGTTPSAHAEHGTGIGLANTRARLHTLFGADASVTLTHEAAGTTVTVRLPLAIPDNP